jgi:hypothetical protein
MFRQAIPGFLGTFYNQRLYSPLPSTAIIKSTMTNKEYDCDENNLPDHRKTIDRACADHGCVRRERSFDL